MSGKAPFGLRRQNGKLVPHPLEAAVVREVVEAFLRTGGRLKATAADLNVRGLRTRQDAKWTDTAVGRVLRLVDHEGVIPADLRDRCLAILQDRKARPDGAARRAIHPLGNVTECGCTARMYQEDSGGSKFICRGCRSKIPVDTLERVFVESLASIELDAEDVVVAVADNPRAGELTRRLGGQPVPVSSAWAGLDAAERRLFVDTAVARVVVHPDRVTVVFALEAESSTESRVFPENALPSPDDARNRRGKATEAPDRPISTAPISREDLPLLLPVEIAAELLHTSPKAIYAMAERGQLPGAVRVGRRLLIRRDELLDSIGGSRALSPKEVRR
jgi:excisionase family DNA binding protein